jgi:DNA repair exonuclease SbcCD nuclease subunit
MIKILFIGDVHIKHDNIEAIHALIATLMTINDQHIDCVVFAGDILDKHERVDVQLLNRAYQLIKCAMKISKVYVIVGNHDMINNQQFLTEEHWMNGMKQWDGVTVVDTPITCCYNGVTIIMCPYVFPGRFTEALDTVGEWKRAHYIFAHQEFRGCTMGAMVSEMGDVWDVNWPHVISGHIHARQTPQSNILYPGSVITHAFGSSSMRQGCSLFTLEPSSITEQFIELHLQPKRTIYKKIGESIRSKDIVSSNRFSMTGSVDEIAEFKHSRQFKELKRANVKVVFKICGTTSHNIARKSFMSLVREKVMLAADTDKEIVNDYLDISKSV